MDASFLNHPGDTAPRHLTRPQPLQPALAGLTRLPGVLGVFACGSSAKVVQAAMPSRYDANTLERTAARLWSMFEACRAPNEQTQRLSLGWPEHRLEAFATPAGMVGVLTSREVDVTRLATALPVVLSAVAASGLFTSV
jgi:hypothetical protein